MIEIAQSRHDLALCSRPHPSEASVGLRFGRLASLPVAATTPCMPATVHWPDKDESRMDFSAVFDVFLCRRRLFNAINRVSQHARTGARVSFRSNVRQYKDEVRQAEAILITARGVEGTL